MDGATQNLTDSQPSIDQPTAAVGTIIEDEPTLKYRQQMYVDFCATGGLRVEEDGEATPITVTDFAQDLGVSRWTLYNWQKIIPNFQARVAQRRKEIGSGIRTSQVWKGIFAKARSGDPAAGDMWLTNFDPNYKSPRQKVEHEVGKTFVDLIMAVEERKRLGRDDNDTT